MYESPMILLIRSAINISIIQMFVFLGEGGIIKRGVEKECYKQVNKSCRGIRSKKR
jgi:hypothetical protein